MPALLLEIAGFVIAFGAYIVSQGQAFSTRFQHSRVARFILGIIALISFALLVKEVVQIYRSAAPGNSTGTETANVAAPVAVEDHCAVARAAAQARNHQQAVTSFNSCILLQTGNVEAFVGRAASYVALGRYDEAMADYDYALRLRPGHEPATQGKQRAMDGKTDRLLAPLWSELEANTANGL